MTHNRHWSTTRTPGVILALAVLGISAALIRSCGAEYPEYSAAGSFQTDTLVVTSTATISGLLTASGGITSTVAANTLGDIVENCQTQTTSSNAQVNNLTLDASSSCIRWTATVASPQWTGLTGGTSGRRVTLQNSAASTVSITYFTANGNSTVGNRLSGDGCTGGCLLAPGQSATLTYDGANSTWSTNVAIGANTPGALTVNGTLNTTSNATVGATFIINNGTGDDYAITGQAVSAGNSNLNIDAGGTGTIRFNSNTGSLTNAGTGGLALYAGANSATSVWTVSNAGNQINSGTLSVTGASVTRGTATRQIDTDGSSRPTIQAGTCGTSPTVVGNDASGYIIVGTGGAATCQLNFHTAMTKGSCTWDRPGNATKGTATAPPLTASATYTATLSAGETLTYSCSDH